MKGQEDLAAPFDALRAIGTQSSQKKSRGVFETRPLGFDIGLSDFGLVVFMSPKDGMISSERIEKLIFLIRRQRVMLDADLADLYGVPVKRLNEQVRRNSRRFPADFMICLTQDEYEALRSHFATLKPGRGEHRKYLPYAFTEQGFLVKERGSAYGRSKKSLA